MMRAVPRTAIVLLAAVYFSSVIAKAGYDWGRFSIQRHVPAPALRSLPWEPGGPMPDGDARALFEAYSVPDRGVAQYWLKVESGWVVVPWRAYYLPDSERGCFPALAVKEDVLWYWRASAK